MTFFNKKQTTILLAIITVVGSIIAFYGTNLLLSDLSNMFYMTISQDIITSLPIFIISIQMVSGFICLIDLDYRPANGRKYIVRCMDVLVFTSLIGLGATIVSYTTIYHKFMAPYPFKGASIILLVYYVLVFAGSSFLNVWGQGLPKPEKKALPFRRILFRMVRIIFIYYAFNRFGAFLCSPSYMRIKTFWLTLPFYLSLLIPIILTAFMVLYNMYYDVKWAKSGLILAIILFVADIVFFAAIFFLGSKYTEFPAAISPAIPLERLIKIPLDVIVQSVISTAMGLYALIAMLKRYKREQRGN